MLIIFFLPANDWFGTVEKEWVTTYNPELRYSGKEREKGAQADYFGARYFTNVSYRWLSPDPVMETEKAMANPQLWNRYAYCRNSPVTYWDPDGRDQINIFFGFSAKNAASDGSGKLAYFPDFSRLTALAGQYGHILEVQAFNKENILSSLSAENTWTIYVGHSGRDRDSNIRIGIAINGILSILPTNSPNKIVGIFACDSQDFAFSIKGPQILAIDSNRNSTSANGLAAAAYSSLIRLIQGKDISAAAREGTKAMTTLQHLSDKGDRVVW